MPAPIKSGSRIEHPGPGHFAAWSAASRYGLVYSLVFLASCAVA